MSDIGQTRVRRASRAAVRAAYRIAYAGARLWWFLRRPHTSSALVAMWHGERLLLVRTCYRRLHALPGGFLRRGEPPAIGAAREVREELAVELAPGILTEVWRGARRFEHRDDTITIFAARVDRAPEVRIDHREIEWAGWVTRDEALARPLLPHVRDYLDAAPQDACLSRGNAGDPQAKLS